MPGPDISESELRAMVRQLLESGAPPAVIVHSVDGGYGSERSCRFCGLEIQTKQVEYVVREHSPAQGPYHMKCYASWQLECAERLQAKAAAET